MRPDPRQARTGAELAAALRGFWIWAGEPSCTVMAEECSQLVSRSSLHRALTSQDLPAQKAVLAVVIGCGGSEEDQRRFASAWRMIRTGRQPAAGSAPLC